MIINLEYLPLSGVYSLALSLVYILQLAAKNYLAGDASPGPATTVHEYIPVAYVTAASMIMYYIFLFHQSAVAFSELNKAKLHGKKKTDDKNAASLTAIKYGSDNANIIAANRLVGNFHEQVIPFLVTLYLYAAFVSVKGASTYGWAWLLFRSYYGFAYKKGLPMLFLSTLPAYCCVWYMLGGTIYEISSIK